MSLIELVGHPFILLILRLATGTLWLVSAIGKWMDRGGFIEAVVEYEVLSERSARLYARGLPWIEVTVGALLLLGVWTSGAAAVSVLLLVSFSYAIAVNLARGRELDCHCLGRFGGEKINAFTLIRSLLLIAVSIILLRSQPDFLAVDRWIHKEIRTSMPVPPLAEFIPALFLILLAVIAYGLLRQGWELIQAGRITRGEER